MPKTLPGAPAVSWCLACHPNPALLPGTAALPAAADIHRRLGLDPRPNPLNPKPPLPWNSAGLGVALKDPNPPNPIKTPSPNPYGNPAPQGFAALKDFLLLLLLFIFIFSLLGCQLFAGLDSFKADQNVLTPWKVGRAAAGGACGRRARMHAYTGRRSWHVHARAQM